MKTNEISVKEKLSDGTYIEDTTGYCPAFTVGVETACRVIQEIWDKGHAGSEGCLMKASKTIEGGLKC